MPLGDDGEEQPNVSEGFEKLTGVKMIGGGDGNGDMGMAMAMLLGGMMGRGGGGGGMLGGGRGFIMGGRGSSSEADSGRERGRGRGYVAGGGEGAKGWGSNDTQPSLSKESPNIHSLASNRIIQPPLRSPPLQADLIRNNDVVDNDSAAYSDTRLNCNSNPALVNSSVDSVNEGAKLVDFATISSKSLSTNNETSKTETETQPTDLGKETETSIISRGISPAQELQSVALMKSMLASNEMMMATMIKTQVLRISSSHWPLSCFRTFSFFLMRDNENHQQVSTYIRCFDRRMDAEDGEN